MNNQPVPLSFTVRYKGIVRSIATYVHIFLPGRYPTDNKGVNAIWDTGATASAITTNVVSKLGLIPSGKAYMQTPNGAAWKNTYTVDMGLPNGYIVPGIVVAEVDKLGGNADVLIGMDIIQHGDFSVTNYNGKTTMSFRMPSLHEVDYTGQPKKVSQEAGLNSSNPFVGVSRNQLCPCDSGKKFKHCHGK